VLLLMVVTAPLTISVLRVGLPLVATQTSRGALALGTLLSAMAVGGFLGSIAAGLMTRPSMQPFMKARFVVAIASGGIIAAIGSMTSFWAAAGLIALLGFASQFVSVHTGAWLQASAPLALAGRTVGVAMFVATAAMPFALLGAGALAEINVQLMFGAAGGLMALVGVMLLLSRSDAAFRDLGR
jgi:hypothetical protein